jgi:RNA polymerase sigma-70 factor (ECF subfamily)
MVLDAIQDALIAIHEKRHTYSPNRPFKPWLSAIARYKWIDRLRQMSRVQIETLGEETAVEGHEDSILGAVVLDQLLAEIKPTQAQVIRLAKLHGLSIEEASEHAGQSISLVKVNIHRGIARLSSIVRSQSHVG